MALHEQVAVPCADMSVVHLDASAVARRYVQAYCAAGEHPKLPTL